MRCDALRGHICTSIGSHYTHLTHLYLFEWMNEIKPAQKILELHKHEKNEQPKIDNKKARAHTFK